MAERNEFIEAYSDDQIYVIMLSELIEQHPIESLSPDSIKYSSYCRLFAFMSVGAIESMIKVSIEEEAFSDISAYLKDPQDNANRVSNLQLSLEKRGINIDEDLFKDFLAMKYIRNAYVHSHWRDLQRDFAVTRGFPKNVTSFTKQHLLQMQEAYQHVMNCLGMAKCLLAILLFSFIGGSVSLFQHTFF